MNYIDFQNDRSIDFIGLGRLAIDLNANEIHRPLEETQTFTRYLGGSPANITVAMAKLGMKTGFIGRVSNDAFGRYIMNYLKTLGVDTSNVVVDQSGAVTGLAFTEIKSPTDCSILMYRDNAADLKLEPKDVKEAYIRKAKALLISGTALAKSPSREAVFQALEYARKHRVVTIFDIDYRNYTWTSREETSVYCKLAAAQSDIIIGGREEFDLMEEMDGPLRKDDQETANRWFAANAKIVVVKHGEKGSIAYTKGGNVDRRGVFPAEVVKTFGAGDSFAGAFVFGLMKGWDVGKCQEYGSAAAAIVVSSHSCSDAMPTERQIEELIERHMLQN